MAAEPRSDLAALRADIERLLAEPGSPDSELVRRLQLALLDLSRAEAGTPEYRVVLAAPMKAGKSTLLNALLCQDLLPARGSAMTMLPTRVVVVPLGRQRRPVLRLAPHTAAALQELLSRLLHPENEAAVRQTTRGQQELAHVMGASCQRLAVAPVVGPYRGYRSVRRRLAMLNDTVRLAALVLPAGVLHAAVRDMQAPEVVVPVPWMAQDVHRYGHLVLIDTPGPDETLLSGVLDGLVIREFKDAHELLVVADATRVGSTAEASVRRLVQNARRERGPCGVLVAANRADLVRGPVPLRAVQRRVDPFEGPADRAVATNARLGLSAAGVLWPALSGSPGREHERAAGFLELVFPLDWEEVAPSVRPAQLRRWCTEAWHRSGVAELLDRFVTPLAVRPGFSALARTLAEVASVCRDLARNSGSDKRVAQLARQCDGIRRTMEVH
ncbi:hypothetical protein [Streptomyces sp. NPDC050416]|uniref:hypothetical protein n=1 Tax=Streptomyces sp. NPDC050416 TaxID=3365611 RepID=UPI003799E8EB